MAETLERFNRLNTQLWGFDKTIRLTHYLLRTLKNVLINKGRTEQAEAIGKFASQLSNYRMITRFSGVPATIESFFALKDEKDPLLRAIASAQAVSMLGYYPLEHIAWLSDNGIIRKIDTDPLWRLSSMSWWLYVVLDLIVAFKKHKSLSKQIERVQRRISSSVSTSEESKEAKKQLSDLLQQKRIRFLQTVTVLCDFVLAWHWSVKTSPFSDLMIGIVGSIGSMIGFYFRWKAAA